MITGEQLAAYAAGEADPAQRARIEAALPGDPELRARLEAIRRADELLATQPPVELPDEVAARITAGAMASARRHLDEQATPGAAVVDLSARRQQRWRWVAAAAAAVAVVAVGGTVAVDRLGTGGADMATDEAATDTMAGGEATEPADGAAEAQQAPPAADETRTEDAATLAVPVVVDDGLVLDSLDDLAAAMTTSDAVAEEEGTAAGGEQLEASDGERGDGTVSPVERETALACTGAVDGLVDRATLAILADGREVVVYESVGPPRRYVAVDPDGCRVLADQPAE